MHFRSIKTLDSHSDLYQSLKKINVSTSNSISKKLSITQAGETFNVTLQKADVHLEGEDSLDIYVPTDPRGFKRCWPIDIIPRIKIWLGVSDVLGNDVLQQIFIRDDLELLDEDLEKKGIRTVDGVHRDPKHTGITSNPSIGRITTAPPENQPFGYSLPGATPNASSSTCTQDLRLRVSSNVRPELRTTTSGMGRGSAIPELRDPKYGDVDGYREILKGVITAAQNAVIPDRHITKPQQILLLNSEKLKQAEAFGPANVNNWRNVHRDRKVGAAGELYVWILVAQVLSMLTSFRFLNYSRKWVCQALT